MIDKVIAGEDVHELPVAGEVRGSDGYQLAVPAGHGKLGPPGEEFWSVRIEKRGRHEDDGLVARSGQPEDGARRHRITTDQPADQHVGVVGSHEKSLDARACAVLTFG